MKVLHILKTEPDDVTKSLLSTLSTPLGKEATLIRLNDSTDYEELIDLIFGHDKVICWW